MYERSGPEDQRRDARRLQQENARKLEAYLKQREQQLRTEIGRQLAMQNRGRSVQEEAREYLAANTHYAQLVMVVGYGAFFTLWLQTKQQMSGWLFASTGLLITISLLVFIVVELAKTYIQGRYLPLVIAGKLDQAAYEKKVQRIARHWLWTFLVSVATGLAAGCSLLFWFLYRTVLEGFALLG